MLLENFTCWTLEICLIAWKIINRREATYGTETSGCARIHYEAILADEITHWKPITKPENDDDSD